MQAYRETPRTEAWTGTMLRGRSEGVAISKPRRRPSEETKPADTLISELGGNKVLWFKPPSPGALLWLPERIQARSSMHFHASLCLRPYRPLWAEFLGPAMAPPSRPVWPNQGPNPQDPSGKDLRKPGSLGSKRAPQVSPGRLQASPRGRKT